MATSTISNEDKTRLRDAYIQIGFAITELRTLQMLNQAHEHNLSAMRAAADAQAEAQKLLDQVFSGKKLSVGSPLHRPGFFHQTAFSALGSHEDIDDLQQIRNQLAAFMRETGIEVPDDLPDDEELSFVYRSPMILIGIVFVAGIGVYLFFTILSLLR